MLTKAGPEKTKRNVIGKGVVGVGGDFVSSHIKQLLFHSTVRETCKMLLCVTHIPWLSNLTKVNKKGTKYKTQKQEGKEQAPLVK